MKGYTPTNFNKQKYVFGLWKKSHFTILCGISAILFFYMIFNLYTGNMQGIVIFLIALFFTCLIFAPALHYGYVRNFAFYLIKKALSKKHFVNSFKGVEKIENE